MSRDRKNSLTSLFIAIVGVTFLSGILAEYPTAHAELATPNASNSTAPLATEEQYCDAVCPNIANSNGQLVGLSGSAGWSSTDDQWCANHNSQTNPSVMSSPAPLGATLPTESCTVSYYPGDTSCAATTAGFNRCQYKNSQVESYCQAYESAKMAGAGEDMVLLLDIAATATCATACAIEATGIGNTAGTTALKFCNFAATGAGALEILVTLTQKSSAMGKIADAALGAAGIGEGLMGLLSSKGKQCRNDRPEESLFAYVASLMIKNAEAASSLAAPYLYRGEPLNSAQGAANPAAASNPDTNKGCTKEACITAATMAALTGVRYYNNGYGKRSKASSCNSIWGLQSSANAIAGGITAAGYTASGGTTSTSSGSSVGSTGSTTGSTTGATGGTCTGANLTSAACGQISAATDGGILTKSGLGSAVNPLAQQLGNSGALQAAQSGGLGSAMGGAMSGSGDVGTAMAKIAQGAFDNAKELGQVAQMSYSGGGGGGAPTATDTNALGNLFGNSAPAAATAPMQVFKGDGEDADDIWHSHSSSNLFQIVSHRIGKVNP